MTTASTEEQLTVRRSEVGSSRMPGAPGEFSSWRRWQLGAAISMYRILNVRDSPGSTAKERLYSSQPNRLFSRLRLRARVPAGRARDTCSSNGVLS